MSERIDRTGVFRGRITQHGITTTKNDFPQLILEMDVIEFWDENGDLGEGDQAGVAAWVDWEEYGQDAIGYFVLANASGPIFNTESVIEALGWDGSSYAQLDAMDLEGTTVMFAVEENDWEGRVSLQVGRLKHTDATPGREMRKLDAEALKALDARLGKAVTVTAAAKPKKKATPKKAAVAKRTPVKKSKPAARPTVAKATVEPKTDLPGTADTAWDALHAFGTKLQKDDAAIGMVWSEAINGLLAAGQDEDSLTSEQWGQVFTLASGALAD